MTTLTTGELEERHAATMKAEKDCRAALERLKIIRSASRGDEPSAQERGAEAALAKAASATARLDTALSVARARDAATARATATMWAETDDLLTRKALADVEALAGKLSKALAGYVQTYDAFCRAVQHAQARVSYNPRLRHGASLPSPAVTVADEMARLSVGATLPPGASTHAVQFGDPADMRPLADVYASHIKAHVLVLARDCGGLPA